MANNELSPEDKDLAAKIRQIEAETMGLQLSAVRKEKLKALLTPKFGGKEPEEIIKVCHMVPVEGTGFEQHTYYAETETPAGKFPSPEVLPPHIAQLFTGGDFEPCLQHLIETNIGVTAAYLSQKKVLPYEMLPAPAKNQQDLERLVTAATQDYALVNREMKMPAYMNEKTRKMSAVVFKNAEMYTTEEARQQVVQLLKQIDNAITLRSEGKISEEEVRALIAKLREKPWTQPQQLAVAKQKQPLEQEVSETYKADIFTVPAILKNAEDINLVLQMFKTPYEVVLDTPPSSPGLFRFTQPGYSDNVEKVEEASNIIRRLDVVIGMWKGGKTTEEKKEALLQISKVFGKELRFY